MKLRARLKAARTVSVQFLKAYVAHEHRVGSAENLKETEIRNQYMCLPGRALKGSYGHVAVPRSPSL